MKRIQRKKQQEMMFRSRANMAARLARAHAWGQAHPGRKIRTRSRTMPTTIMMMKQDTASIWGWRWASTESDSSSSSTSSSSTSLGNIFSAASETGEDERMQLIFTCAAAVGEEGEECGHRVKKVIKKHAYENGVVVVRCPACKNLHLIADRLAYFGEDWSVQNSDANVVHVGIEDGELDEEVLQLVPDEEANR